MIALKEFEEPEVSKSIRRELENYLYTQWVKSDEPKRELIERELRELLMNHAQAVMYIILRRGDRDLLTEAVDKVMVNLPTFRGDSLFTTWVHRILMGVMYDQRRMERKRKEVSLDVPGFDLPGDSSPGVVDLLLTVKQLLTPADFTIFEEVAIWGKSHGEAAKSLNIPKATITRKWDRISRTLRHAFTK